MARIAPQGLAAFSTSVLRLRLSRHIERARCATLGTGEKPEPGQTYFSEMTEQR